MGITPPLGQAAGQINMTFNHPSTAVLHFLYKVQAEHHRTPHFLSFHSCQLHKLSLSNLGYLNVSELLLRHLGQWLHALGHAGGQQQNALCVTTPH